LFFNKFDILAVGREHVPLHPHWLRHEQNRGRKKKKGNFIRH